MVWCLFLTLLLLSTIAVGARVGILRRRFLPNSASNDYDFPFAGSFLKRRYAASFTIAFGHFVRIRYPDVFQAFYHFFTAFLIRLAF